uniref:Exocyst complex component n=1 Tax=Plectus sambesii TaxID=2011161 RepID=A0A914VGU5_9BILA
MSSSVGGGRDRSADGGSSSAKGGGGGSDAGSTSFQTGPDVSPEQEFFLYELETSDSGSIGLVLRAIYDGGDVHKFLRALENKIRHYDKDIEKVCSFHYQGFIEAIRELLQLKTRCQVLRDDTECIDQHLEESSRSLLSKSAEIVRYRKLQRNICTAIDSLSLCLPVLEKYGKLEEQMQQKRYYPALKTLEQLEHTYLPQVNKYRFTQKLTESVGKIRERIKEASFSEFTDFLENIRKVAANIGKIALRQTAEFHDLDSAASQNARKAKYAAQLRSPQRTIKLGDDGALSGDERARPKKTSVASAGEENDFSAQDMIDFSPVYRCCHIFTVLGAKDTFDAYYRKQRREQAAIILRAPDKLATSQALDLYVGYFHEVIGFFVVEDHIMQTAPGLVTRSYRDELWELALLHVTRTLNSHFGNCLEPHVMLQIKKLILLFALTMKGYGFTITSFYKLLQNFRDQYNEILMAECCASFDRILADDNYTPITVKDEAAFRHVLDRFPISKRGLEQEPFPRKFPFSEFVPTLYDQSKTYVRGCLKFMEHLALSQSEIDDTVRRYANVLLERLSGSLRGYVAQKRLALVQLVQITINVGYLEKSCESLEQYISKLTSEGEGGGSTGHLVRLKEDVFRVRLLLFCISLLPCFNAKLIMAFW